MQCSTTTQDVIRCEMRDACQVWEIANDCDGDGLLCENAACVCPDSGSSMDFYANPVVDRTGFEGLLPTGVQTPAVCSFSTLGIAIMAAQNASLDFFPARAIADDQARDGSRSGAVFDEELPIVVGKMVTVTTVDDPELGGSGFDPSQFVIVLNANLETVPDASIILEGAADSSNSLAPGSSLRGFTIEEGPPRFSEPWWISPVAIEMRGYAAEGSDRLVSVVVDGSKGVNFGATENNPLGIYSGGTIAPQFGEVTFTTTELAVADAVNWPVVFLVIEGASNADNNGVFRASAISSNGTVEFHYANELAFAGDSAGTFRVYGPGQLTTGLKATGIGVVKDSIFGNFVSDYFGEKVGVDVAVSDFTAPNHSVQFLGTGIHDSDTGLLVTAGNVTLADSITTRSMLHNNGIAGMHVNSTDLGAPVAVEMENVLVVANREAGINVFGTVAPSVFISFSEIRGNGGYGLRTGNMEGVVTPISIFDTDIQDNVGIGVRAFTGIRMEAVVVTNNREQGVLLTQTQPTERSIIVGSTITNNGSDGIHVVYAPLDRDIGTTDDVDELAVEIAASEVAFNDGDGIRIGLDNQSMHAWVAVGDASVHGNLGVGIRIRGDGLASDCTSYGCTAVNLSTNVIVDNGLEGVTLEKAMLKTKSGTESGFHTNLIAGNGGVTTCTEVGVPQVRFLGPSLYASLPEASYCLDNGGGGAAACDSLNDPGTSLDGKRHTCAWIGFSCVTSWDISGGDCSAANNFARYTLRGQGGAGAMSAINFAVVKATNNIWRSGTPTDNVDVDGTAIVIDASVCPTRLLCE